MSLLRSMAGGLRSLFRKEQVSRELHEELKGFLEMAVEEKLKQGMSRKDALRAVRLVSLPKTPLADRQRSKPCCMPSCLRSNLRAALVLPQESEICKTNEHTARSTFPSQRLEVFCDQAALRV
jgi:hypothetical protein